MRKRELKRKAARRSRLRQRRGSVSFASTGMRYADDRISDASASYVCNASPDGSNFKLQLDPFLQ